VYGKGISNRGVKVSTTKVGGQENAKKNKSRGTNIVFTQVYLGGNKNISKIPHANENKGGWVLCYLGKGDLESETKITQNLIM